MIQRIEYYSDYRKYLEEFYEDRKEQWPFFSYRYFCKKAGIKSPSLFKDVVSGKRNLTPDTISAFIKGLGLNESDGRFFSALVHFNQAKNPSAKQQHLEEMRGLKRRVKQEMVPIDQYEYFSRWYHPVIRELACQFDWKEDFELLAQLVEPPIKKSEARESVKLLLELGFLEKRRGGKYFQTYPAITSGSEVISAGIRSLNKKMAFLGAEAIENFQPSERDIQSMTIGISRETYELIKPEILEFKRRIIRLVEDDTRSDRVYNFNIHLFPLTKKRNVDSKGNVQ